MADDAVLDVPALTALLDGKYAEVRQPRAGQPRRARVDPRRPADDAARRVPRAGARGRAADGRAPGRPASASPRSTAAGTTSAPRSRRSRRWRSATSPWWSRSACSSGCSAARSSSSAPSRTTTPTSTDLIHGRLLGCFAMTESGHGSNVQALGTTATYDAERPRVRHRHPRRPGPQGLHRQRRPARRRRGGLRPARGRRRVARRARVRRTASATRTATRCPACGSRTAARRSGSTASTTGGSGSTACGSRAPTCSTATPWSPTTAATSPTSRTADRRFFTMLGTLVQGRVCVGGAGDQRLQGGAGDRDRVRPPPSPVRQPGLRDRGAAARLRHAPAPAVPAAGPDLRAALRPGAGRRRPARGVHPTSRTTGPPSWPAARSSRGRPAPRRSAPGTRPGPSRSAARPAAARATSRSTGSTRCAPTPTCSPPSRATTRS